MQVLVSNDDGVEAPGIRILAGRLAEFGTVTVVAPDRDRSGASNSLTLDAPIRTHRMENGFYRVSGTPTDCVHLALAGMLDHETDIVVSSHACGALTDLVLSRASTARARVAVLPCCHDEETCDMGGLGGWLESSLAIDVVRAARLEASGYRVWTQTIPADITPKNRLLLGVPVGPASPRAAV